MSKNDSESNTKIKVSFDIDNVKKPTKMETRSLEKRPVFSIRHGQTEYPGKTEVNSTKTNNQAPASDRPVFDIHADAEPQVSGDNNSVSVARDSLTEVESAPQIAVQSKVSAHSTGNVAGSQSILSTRDDLMVSLASTTQNFSSANHQMSEKPEIIEESQNSEIKSEDAGTPIDSMQSEQAKTELAESTDIQSQASQVVPPRPQKTSGEKVKPIFTAPKEEQTKEKQPNVQWNGPQVQKRTEPEPSHTETRSSVYHHAKRSQLQSARREERHPKKQSGVLGKSFLAMLGIRIRE